MTGPRQAAQLIRHAIRAGVAAEVFPEANTWTAVIGDLETYVEVSWMRHDGRWVVASAGRELKPMGYDKVRRLVKKGLR